MLNQPTRPLISTDLINQQIDIPTTKLTRLIEVSRLLNSATSIDELLNIIITEAAELTDAEAASILLQDDKTHELRFKATSNEVPPEMINMPVPLKGSIAGQIFRANRPMVVSDVSGNPSWNPTMDKTSQFSTTAILGVPMHDGSGDAIGVLEAINKIEGTFTEEDENVLSVLADLAGAGIGKAKLFDELQRAYTKLNELDRLKSDFIALASHELRTPLSIILGYVTYLREMAEPSLGSQLDSMLRAAIRLRGIIQDMLNLRYVDAGEASLAEERFDVIDVIRHIVAERDSLLEEKRHTVMVHLPRSPLIFNGDKDMIEVALSNLFNNAIKFTPNEGRIDIGANRRGDEIWIYVRDNGIGIASDQVDRIFDRFYQVEPHMRRRFEGMGIGLSIAKELITLHQGRIWAESEEGKGSEFYVALPLAPNHKPLAG